MSRNGVSASMSPPGSSESRAVDQRSCAGRARRRTVPSLAKGSCGRRGPIRSLVASIRSSTARAVSPPGRDGAPTPHAARSSVDRPARSIVATMLPADEPTMTSAVRGSQPRWCSKASKVPAWNAAPATPPAPRTRPTRGAGASRAAGALTPLSVGCLVQGRESCVLVGRDTLVLRQAPVLLEQQRWANSRRGLLRR